MSAVLVVGGTGPSGVALVNRLAARGDRVTVVHTGAHEVPFEAPVEHLHLDTGDLDQLRRALGSRSFDRAISTSGRLRHVVTVLAGRVDKLVAVTGLPAYPGWLVPPGAPGYPVPLREDDPPARALDGADGDALTTRVIDNERRVLEAHARGAFRAAVVRYTMVYGPYSYVPFEWYFVRRVLDGRRRLALEADGLMLPQRGYSENLAAAVLLVLGSADADGRIFNVGDEQLLSVRAIAETIAEELGHRFEVVPVPLVASPCGNPFALRQNTGFNLRELYTLGYREAVGVVEATRTAARWLAEHQVEPGSAEERSLGPRAFDYVTEDAVMDVYEDASGRARAAIGEESVR